MNFFSTNLDDKGFIELDKTNLMQIHKMSLFVIINEIFMIIFGLLFNLSTKYLIAYFVLLGLAVYFYFITSKYKEDSKINTNFVLELGIYCFIAWGTVVSSFDILKGYGAYVYLINISFIACFFIFTPISSLVFNIINFTLFALTFLYIDKFTMDILFNFILFHGVIFIIGINRFRSFEKGYKDSVGLKIANQELYNLSTIDQLSGCKNRRGLDIEIQKYNNQVIFALLTDIDNFKKLNDRYGHDIGDLFLVNFAKILQANFGLHNVFRIGGDEFFIVTNNDTLQTCLKKFEISRKEISNISFVKNPEVNMTISAGYTYKVLKGKESFETMYKDLDIALYKAKDKGKNYVVKADDFR